jgi:hypothetical protein
MGLGHREPGEERRVLRRIRCQHHNDIGTQTPLELPQLAGRRGQHDLSGDLWRRLDDVLADIVAQHGRAIGCREHALDGAAYGQAGALGCGHGNQSVDGGAAGRQGIAKVIQPECVQVVMLVS